MGTDLCLIDGVPFDPVAAPVLAAVLDTLVDFYDELAAEHDEVVAPCAAGVVAGAAAAIDRGMDQASGCGGMLWVRLVEVYPTGLFPALDATPAGERDLTWAVTVEVGVVRPAPVVLEVNNELVLPSMDEEQKAASTAALDASIVRRALLERYADDGEIGIVLGRYVPFGPDGDVVGGVTTATIEVV